MGVAFQIGIQGHSRAILPKLCPFAIVEGMIPTKAKQKIVENYKLHEKDSGSSEVQIALLTEEMKRLASHLKTNPKDVHSRRGLLRMVARRKSLLNYLKKEDEKRYSDISKKIGLKTK